MKRIEKILIANRGEIALRVIRTCRRMGIATVAVHSDADGGALHVQAADEAVRLGPAPAAESYLVIDKILGAAELTGADAIHPGYGFLAENADFARACAERGVIFIGPSPEAIALLGSKRDSKRQVAAAGVPVIPGYDGAEQDAATFAQQAEEMGFPVLLKASAGGGGKGMRIVHRGGDDMAAAVAAAKREAKGAFGDDTLLMERYLERPRHVEFQILGDQHGNLIHLFERECSIQRRHQKIIEESPSPALDDELRRRMGEAATTVGRAVGYHNAGTVELMLAPDRSFYFLEVNTRLQVEHPVTEYLTGIDLVREQIRVAQGEVLELSQAELSQRGAAIEARLYAEDPDNQFLPVTGTVLDWHPPEGLGDGLRIDSGVATGSEVSIHYDPLLAKVICHAETRAEAIAKLRYSLRALSVQGLVTNRAFLVAVLSHPDFVTGNVDTHFLQTHEIRAAAPGPAERRDAAIAATLADHERRRAERTILPHLEPGYRNSRAQEEWVDYRVGGELLAVRYVNQGGGRFSLTVAGEAAECRLISVVDRTVIWETRAGLRRRYRVVPEQDGAERRHHVHSLQGSLLLVEEPRFPATTHTVVEGACTAPMPGKVVKILVAEGQRVVLGEAVIILEAMKMEHAVTAAEDGVVAQVCATEGEQVETDQLLVVIKGAE